MDAKDSPQPVNDGLGRKAARGAAITVVGQFGKIIIQLVSVVVLARLLSPNDYGLFAMVMSVAGIAEVFRDFGLSQAVVQAKSVSREQRDSLFWINSGIGLALSLIVFFGSWGIAAFYGHPELAPLAQVAAIVFLVNGFTTQYRASLTRSLRFKALAVIDVVSSLVAMAIAIFMGLAGLGAWALVGQLIIQAFLVLVSSAICARWIPRWPKRSTSIRKFMHFGGNMVATQIITYIGGNADRVIIGLFLGAAPLGIYTRPYQLVMNIANQLRAPITSVAIPVLSRLQNSHYRYWDFTRLGQAALGYSILPALGLAAGAAEPLTEILLGSQWLASAPILSVLSAAAGLQTLGYFGYWVYVSKGITGVLFRYNLLSVSIKVLALFAGTPWGVAGVATGYLLATLVSWPLSLIWINKNVSGVPMRSLTYGFVRMGLLASGGGSAAHFAIVIINSSSVWLDLVAASIGILAFYSVATIIPSVRRDMHGLIALRSYLKRSR